MSSKDVYETVEKEKERGLWQECEWSGVIDDEAANRVSKGR